LPLIKQKNRKKRTPKQMPEADISPAGGLPTLDSLPPASDASDASTAALLAKACVLKLNGGLGTSMGLEKAKSLLPVKDGHAFLDLIALQIRELRKRHSPARVRFVLMDSFATSADTRALLRERHPELLLLSPGGGKKAEEKDEKEEEKWELMQNKSPKVDAATLAPALWPKSEKEEWCPPGHGDIYPSLLGSGMLDALLGEGVEYLFVSNSDNLGATLDLALLRHFAAANGKGGGGGGGGGGDKTDGGGEKTAGGGGGGGGLAFLMEVAERTAADKKGGHLAVRKSDGKFVLRESAMCPGERREEKRREEKRREGFFCVAFLIDRRRPRSPRSHAPPQKTKKREKPTTTAPPQNQTPTSPPSRTSPCTATSTPTTCGCTSPP